MNFHIVFDIFSCYGQDTNFGSILPLSSKESESEAQQVTERGFVRGIKGSKRRPIRTVQTPSDLRDDALIKSDVVKAREYLESMKELSC